MGLRQSRSERPLIGREASRQPVGLRSATLLARPGEAAVQLVKDLHGFSADDFRLIMRENALALSRL